MHDYSFQWLAIVATQVELNQFSYVCIVKIVPGNPSVSEMGVSVQA